MEKIFIGNFLQRLLVFFSLLVVLFTPFDSIPFLPSVYRPLSIIPMIVIFPFVIFRKVSKSFSLHEFYLILFIISSILISFTQVFVRFSNFAGFIDATITLLIGYGFYVVFDYLFSLFKINYNNDYIGKVLRLFGYIFIIPIIFGLFELLVIFEIFDSTIKYNILQWIAGRSTSRIQLFTGEPAWAATQLTFLIPVYIYNYKKSLIFKFGTISSILLLIFTLSLNGFVIIGLTTILFIIRKKNFKGPLLFLFSIISFYFSIPIVIDFIQFIFPTPVYFVNRIIAILQGEILNFNNFLFRDGSTFIRIGYPIIGFYIFLTNPIIGVGIGNYRFVFPSVISNYFPLGLIFQEVQNGILSLEANPKMLLSRILSETGIIGFFLLYKFIRPIYKKILLQKNNSILIFLFILLFSSTLQFDSFAYVFIWLFLAFFNNLPVYNQSVGIKK
jgi:hypothetical protein